MNTRKKNKLVCGVGINDLDRSVYWRVDGKVVICPVYRVWKSMLVRCYDSNFHHKITYVESYVVPEWLRLSNFERWMEQQDWEGKELDKDILFPCNKVYGPETCVFISHTLNTFLIDSAGARGDFPLGTHWHKATQMYAAQCGNPFTKKREHLGLFNNPEDGHLVWKERKHELSCALADKQTDPRVAAALRVRYL